jgi:hypothetical protein
MPYRQEAGVIDYADDADVMNTDITQSTKPGGTCFVVSQTSGGRAIPGEQKPLCFLRYLMFKVFWAPPRRIPSCLDRGILAKAEA